MLLFLEVLWSECLPVIASVFIVRMCLTSGWRAKSTINVPTCLLAQCLRYWQNLHSPSPFLHNLLLCDVLLFKKCFYIYYSMGSPTIAMWYKGVMISFCFIQCRNWSLEIWRGLPKVGSTNSANISQVLSNALCVPGSFQNDYFIVSANKLVSHISTKSSHLFSSAVSMKLGCLLHVMWNCLKNLLL